MYDIANVLTSLGLIKKVHVREERGRKPAFKWLGPVEFNNPGNSGENLRNTVIHKSSKLEFTKKKKKVGEDTTYKPCQYHRYHL